MTELKNNYPREEHMKCPICGEKQEFKKRFKK